MSEGFERRAAEPLSEANIRAFVGAWYRALDVHAPLGEISALLAREGLEMVFPEEQIRSREAFARWYERVTRLFFDEEHYVHDVQIQHAQNRSESSVELRVVVGWQTSLWVPPEPKSRRISLDATQRWVVRRSNANAYNLEIQSYNATLEPFRYAPGFARL